MSPSASRFLVRTADFHYHLPPDLVAQTPAPERDQSRLLVLHRGEGRMEHRRFRDLLEYLRAGDLLVLNDAKVMRARLRGVKPGAAGRIEMLLLEENAPNDWWVMLRPGRRVRSGTVIELIEASGRRSPVTATVLGKNPEGHCQVTFDGAGDIRGELEVLGGVPLPPYIRRPDGATGEDGARYQTVYAQAPGSVAAPTAGLHFTPELLMAIQALGVRLCTITLHVGLGTFAPVKARRLEDHPMHEERYQIGPDAAEALIEAKREGRRVIAVGTTTTRVLETATSRGLEGLQGGAGRTRLFIHPPYEFRMVDALLTNFHLPESTLLMLVSAFAAPGNTQGRELVLNAYARAVAERYHFFSYGDAMLIL